MTIAFGSRDMVMLPGIARRRDQLPDHARWVTLPECGHLQMFDDPAAVVELLRASPTPVAAGNSVHRSADASGAVQDGRARDNGVN